MPTLTPTADKGARSIPTAMTAVDPARHVPPEARESFLDGSGLNGPFVADLLSDMLAHERSGAQLYRSVAGRTHSSALRQRYEHFGEETRQHAEILETLVGRLGGDPLYVSPAARATEKAGMALLESTFLLTGSVDLMTQELVMLDAVMLAEARDHANWSGLAQLVDTFPEGDVRDHVHRAVEQVEPQEDEHLGWAQDTRAELISLRVTDTAMAADAPIEEVVSRIEGWLS